MTSPPEDVVPEPAPTGPRWSVGAVAQRLGVAPATLRTWARRYGLGPSAHTPGAHRRYTAEDVARLDVMRTLVVDGVPPAEAARVARAGAGAGDRTRRTTRGGPGGQVLALPSAGRAARGLGRAAMALDAAAVRRVVRAEVERNGVVHTWEHVLRPVLVAVGERWAATGRGVEVEHLLSDALAVVLRGRAEQLLDAPRHRPVLLACAPDELHALPLHVLAAGLAEREIATRVLGPAMPADALAAAVRRTGPALLFLWSQLPVSASRADLDRLPVTRPATTVVVGGPGWSGTGLPPRVHLAPDLSGALDLAEAAVSGLP